MAQVPAVDRSGALIGAKPTCKMFECIRDNMKRQLPAQVEPAAAERSKVAYYDLIYSSVTFVQWLVKVAS